MEHHPVLSAIATAPVPQNLDDDRQVLSLLPIPQLELSLSFAERRFVEVGTIHFESFVGKSWEVVSRHAVYPLGGNSYGVSWHHGESHLQQFLTNAHQKLTDERWTEETGILLSLQLFRSTYRNSFAELEYLQTWTALEIIVSRLEEQKILSDKEFESIREKLKLCLRSLRDAGTIDHADYVAMNEKLSELNRKSIKNQSLNVLTSLFEAFPEQNITSEDLKTFISIRNSLTHGSKIAVPDGMDYGRYIHEQQGRLSSLLERVYLVLFEQDANLMSFGWPNWLAPR